MSQQAVSVSDHSASPVADWTRRNWGLLAALAAWRTRQLWVAIAVGMVAFWLLRLLP